MCVDEQTAEKIARRKALGRLGALRKSVEMFKVRVGDDWLFGFVKTKFRDEGFQVVVKLAYVDCKGAAFEKMPPEVAEKIKRYVEENFAALLGREFSGLLR
jgi:disulfide oxidoreductase YuzD